MIFASVAIRVRLAYLWRPTLPDPEDDMVLETAMNGSADMIVTLNHRHFKVAASKFAVKIASPQDAMKAIGRLS